MTQNETANPTGATPAPPARPSRRWPWAIGIIVGIVLALPLVALAALWLRLGAGPLALPAPVATRIETRLDQAMLANRVSIAQIELSRPSLGGGLDLVFRDLRLTDPDGAPRAAFPTVIVGLAIEAMVRGRIEPLRVDLEGAGLRLARDETGRIDLDLLTDGASADLSLAESLARLDRMFAAPIFAKLEAVQGTGLELVMADAMTGQTLRVADARMRLEPGDAGLSLRVGGALEGSRAGRIDIALTRSAAGEAAGATDLAMIFGDVAARDVATIGPALAWVDLLRAPISGELRGRVRDDGGFGDLTASLDIGSGLFRPSPEQAAIAFDALHAQLRYEAKRGRIVFDRFDLQAPDLSFAAQGHADLTADESRYIGQFSLADITLIRPDILPDPLVVEGAMVDFQLTMAPVFRIDIGQAVITRQGRALSGRGHIVMPPEGLALALDLSLPHIGVQDVLALWPAALLPDIRGWLDANLTRGQLDGVHLALRRAPGGEMAHALGFGFAEARLRVLPAMPPIEAAAGYLSLTGPQLVLRLDQGRMIAPSGGAVVLDGSGMIIADTRVNGAEAQLDLAVAGGLADVLQLLEAPPLSLFSKSPMTFDRIGTGQAQLRAAVTTRLMTQDGMGATRFEVNGHVTEYQADRLVPGHSLAADRLEIAVTPDAVRVTGAARFDGVLLDGEWHRPLGPAAEPASRLEARVMLSRAGLAGIGVDLPDWLLPGQSEATLGLDLPDGAAAQLVLRSDLSGAGLALPPLGWRQADDQAGRFEAVIQLGPEPAVTRLELALGGLELTGRVALGSDGRFDRLTADRFRLGRWLDVTGALIGRGAGRSPAIEITGGTLDLRGAPQAGGGRAVGEGGTITATLDRLQVTEGIAISPLLADLTSQGGLSGQFRGRVNGEAPVSGTLVNTAAGPAVRIRAQDGGQVLRSAGIFRSAYGGEMELILQASGLQGVYDGTLDIDNPRLRDAPVMAEMLNLVSIVGLLDQLGGDGISMGDVDARFRVTPTQVILAEGVAFGPALGLSLDGTYDLAGRQLDMQGVVSPLNVVNGLVGALFSARREGLFGFAYRLTGPSTAPQVTVNPLSILTPGVFREVFRRPPPS